jgi:hypothetical protein
MLVYFPTESSDQPQRSRVTLVSDGLAAAYSLKHGFEYAIQLEEDGQIIYDKVELARAIARIATLINGEGLTIRKAARRVAHEDGHLLIV